MIRDPVFPDLPSFKEAYRACHGSDPQGPGWAAYKAVLVAGFSAQKNIWIHAEAPPARIEALRQAAAATSTDQEFLTMAADLLGGYGFFLGQEAETMFREATSLDQESREWLLNLLRDRFDVAL